MLPTIFSLCPNLSALFLVRAMAELTRITFSTTDFGSAYAPSKQTTESLESESGSERRGIKRHGYNLSPMRFD